MNLESRKISFVQEFLRLQNEEIVSSLENFLQKQKSELIDADYKPMTMAQLDSEIELAMEDSKNNRMTSVQNLKTKIDQWN
jgi:hypothetical protein